MGNLKGKVFLVIHERKEAHIEIETEEIPFDAFRMCFKKSDVTLDKGDIVEVTPLQFDQEKEVYVEFVSLISKFEMPKWEYEDGEKVTAKLDVSNDIEEESFLVLNHEYLEDEHYYWCEVESTATGDRYDAIAPEKKGEPFTLVTYMVHS